MKVLIQTDVSAFAMTGLPWAIRDPVRNNVLTTNAEAARDGRRSFDDAMWITVLDGAEVVGAAMHTPPYHLFVCPMPAHVVHALAEALAPVRPDLAGVSGETATSREFVRGWERCAGASARPGMAQRLYWVDAVIAPAPVAGRLREGGRADRDLLVTWTRAFVTEAVPDPPMDDLARAVDRILADGGAYLWEVEGAPVCYAAARPPAAGVARIGPVFTPPEHRRRGYGTACTAAVTRRALDRGAEQCMLYTDLANPTSNSIYQQIGYRHVGDAQEYAFTYPEPAGPRVAGAGHGVSLAPPR